MLIPPEASEPIRRQLGIPNRMLNVSVPQVVLNRPRVVAVVRQLVAARVVPHVRMHEEAQRGDGARSLGRGRG